MSAAGAPDLSRGVGQVSAVTEQTRQDAIRAVTYRARVDGWTAAETRQALDVLGLLPAASVAGPLALTCPTCSAPPGVACHTTAVRSRLPGGYHRARQEAA